MLTRPRSGGGLPVRSSGRNADLHDDEPAGPRIPLVGLVLHDRDHPAERTGRATVVDVHDVRVRSRPVEDRPDRSGRRHLDDLVLAGVDAELDVHAALRAIHEVHTVTCHRLEERRDEPRGFDHDRLPGPGTHRCQENEQRHERGTLRYHRYSASTALRASVWPSRHRETSTVSPIRWRASASWK